MLSLSLCLSLCLSETYVLAAANAEGKAQGLKTRINKGASSFLAAPRSDICNQSQPPTHTQPTNQPRRVSVMFGIEGTTIPRGLCVIPTDT
jgi:hypothetical protein